MYKFADSVYFSEIDNQMVLVNAEEGRYFTLNETGAAVAKGLSGGSSMDQIVESLQTEFEIDPVSVRRDCIKLRDELLANGLLKKNSV